MKSISLSAAPQPSGKGCTKASPTTVVSTAAPAKGENCTMSGTDLPRAGSGLQRLLGGPLAAGSSPFARDAQLAFLRKVHGVLSALLAGLQHVEAKCA